MGLDLDLAVSHPRSEFSPEYQRSFALELEAVRLAASHRGIVLPPERALPKRFPFRISIGSYRTASVALGTLETFTRHVCEHLTLPGLPPPPEGAPVPEAVRELRSHWRHGLFGPGACFIPVAFDEPFVLPGRGPLGEVGGALTVASSVHALAALDLLETLATLDDDTLWRLEALLPPAFEAWTKAPDATGKALPRWFDELWVVERLARAARLSVEYRVCFTFS